MYKGGNTKEPEAIGKHVRETMQIMLVLSIFKCCILWYEFMTICSKTKIETHVPINCFCSIVGCEKPSGIDSLSAAMKAFSAYCNGL